MDRLKLLPCPFCGGVSDFRGELIHKYQIECSNCNTRGASFVYSHAAVEAWNRRQSLSQEAVRDEALDDIGQTRNRVGSIFLEAVEKTVFPDNLAIALCSYFERHIDRPENDPQTEHGWGEWAEQKTNEALDLIIRALKREPNAVGQAGQRNDSAPSQEGHAAGPAPAAPDVASMVKRLNDISEGREGRIAHIFKDCREAAALLAKLGQQVETLQAAHDLGWAHKTCPNCGADMMAGASDE